MLKASLKPSELLEGETPRLIDELVGHSAWMLKKLNLFSGTTSFPENSTLTISSDIINKAVLDGGAAVPCNLQSAVAGLNSRGRASLVKQPLAGGDDILVSRNRAL